MTDFTEILYEALGEPLGLVVETDDPVAAKNKLTYQISKNADFADLAVFVSRTAPASQLLIVRRKPRDAEVPDN